MFGIWWSIEGLFRKQPTEIIRVFQRIFFFVCFQMGIGPRRQYFFKIYRRLCDWLEAIENRKYATEISARPGNRQGR